MKLQELLTEMKAQFHRYKDWESYAKQSGWEIEGDGGGKLVAHLDGEEKGLWDPKYGGSGFGWFY